MPKSPAKSSKKRTVKPTREKQSIKTAAMPLAVLPGYLRYAREVWSMLWNQKQLFSRLVIVAWVSFMLVSLVAEQAQYAILSEATHGAVVGLENGYRALIATGVMFASLLSGSLLSALDEGQHAYRAVLFLFLWLVTVWLLRHLMAGTAVKVRDGLYNAGAPLISTLLIALIGVMQLLPLALVAALFAALLNAGVSHFLVVGSMIIASIILSVSTIYWLAGTFFAAIIATIPGTYPITALRSARRAVAGYRRTVLLRLLWLVFAVFAAYAFVMLPLLYIDAALGIVSPFLIVSLSHLLGTVSALYAFTYIYMLYRKIIDGRVE